MSKIQRVGEVQLMQEVIEHREPGDSCTVCKRSVNDAINRWEVLGKNEIMGGKEKQREGKEQSQNKNRNDGFSGRVRNFEREREEMMRVLDELSCKQKTDGPQILMESEIESNESGPSTEKTRPRKKKWKYQARNVVEMRGIKEGITKAKRPSSSMDWESPKPKKSKLNSPPKIKMVAQHLEAKTVAGRLTFENDGSGNIVEFHNVDNEISAVAGNQHRRHP